MSAAGKRLDVLAPELEVLPPVLLLLQLPPPLTLFAALQLPGKVVRLRPQMLEPVGRSAQGQ